MNRMHIKKFRKLIFEYPNDEHAMLEPDDFYMNEQGLMVLTEKFHLKRGHCCGNGCKHCPFDWEGVPEPKRRYLLDNKEAEGKNK